MLTTVRSLQHQRGAAASYPLPRFLEPGNCLPGPSGKAQQFADPTHNAGPDTVREILRHLDRAAHGTRESAAGTRGF
jgi:hypothetical protein